MKTPSEYIKGSISDLLGKVKSVSLSYAYDEEYGQHIIQVRPSSEYSTEMFAQLQLEFESKFIKLYPEEDIAFIGEGTVENLPPFNPISTPKQKILIEKEQAIWIDGEVNVSKIKATNLLIDSLPIISFTAEMLSAYFTKNDWATEKYTTISPAKYFLREKSEINAFLENEEISFDFDDDSDQAQAA